MRYLLLATILCVGNYTFAQELDVNSTVKIPVRPHGKYAFLSTFGATDEATVAMAHMPYTEIAIFQWQQPNLVEMKPGPSYEIVFRSDGTATYEGFTSVERIGKHTGKITLDQYGKICLLLEQFESSGTPLGFEVQTSHPIVSDLTFVRRGVDVPVKRRNDSSVGDYRFWLLQTTIEWTADRIDWTKGSIK
ncbi:hypothetical protein FF011L_19990 [Roseimaritima multifibrata]|uniref:Uncharacterized protein n=1 Tax=Roseimaritima multifibrata TaxID=1930274 RepID=A0A517MEC5_9BACT|nr:DUF6438 domain-containing protein [Roseimaritima multifibrata]QDS93238.1 hypothetical protein FF011L_19990 [Roseimaritima multifibrata]